MSDPKAPPAPVCPWGRPNKNPGQFMAGCVLPRYHGGDHKTTREKGWPRAKCTSNHGGHGPQPDCEVCMEENEAPAPPAPSGRIIPPEEFPGVVHDVADTMELTPAQPAAWDRLAEHDNALRAEVAAATTRAEQAEADLAAARESLGAANDNAEKWRKAGIKAGEEIAALKAKIAAFPVCHLESCVTCAATEARAEKAEAEASRLRGALERIVKHGAADPWLTAIAREALDKTKVPK